LAANGDLNILRFLYKEVLVPFKVCQEIRTGGSSNFAVCEADPFGIAEFQEANWLQKQQQPVNISTLLLNSLDRGEAAVIQLALNKNIQTVCIDEAVGRRVARLSGLSLTGSIGILLRAKQEGYPINIRQAIERMLNRGIRLSASVINFALNQAGESDTST
jgi:predicted nucleic acid-binding protein